jgi:hypothetical protein
VAETQFAAAAESLKRVLADVDHGDAIRVTNGVYIRLQREEDSWTVQVAQERTPPAPEVLEEVRAALAVEGEWRKANLTRRGITNLEVAELTWTERAAVAVK